MNDGREEDTEKGMYDGLLDLNVLTGKLKREVFVGCFHGSSPFIYLSASFSYYIWWALLFYASLFSLSLSPLKKKRVIKRIYCRQMSRQFPTCVFTLEVYYKSLSLSSPSSREWIYAPAIYLPYLVFNDVICSSHSYYLPLTECKEPIYEKKK